MPPKHSKSNLITSSTTNENNPPTKHHNNGSKQHNIQPAIDLVKRNKLLSEFTGGSEYVFQGIILLTICILAFFVRLFSVVRYESVIHEFDPWFNYRTTRYLVEQGIYEFHNWFDDMSWYPLGRFIGGTLYPGLMWTAAAIYTILHEINLPVDIRNVCVLLAPFMAALTALSTYALTSTVWNNSAGLYAAAFISIVPGYISRSVAGSYDNEAVAIFALVFAFYTWCKAVKTGSLLWSLSAAIAYAYMVSTWGGYIFITNLIPAHVLVCMICGRYSSRLYVAYCVWYLIGLLSSMNILFVSFQPVSSPEHLASFGTFGILQLYNIFFYLKSNLSTSNMKLLLRWSGIGVLLILSLVLFLALTGQVPFLTGRLYSLLGATSNLAIVKSVSEHQPSPWTTFFFDLHFLVFLVPVGIYLCFTQLNDVNLFIVIYVLFASYFSSIMVRLVLVLAPGMCVLAGIAASHTMKTFFDIINSPNNKLLIQQARIANELGDSLLDVSAIQNDIQTNNNNELQANELLNSTLGVRTVRIGRVSKPVAFIVIIVLTILTFFYVIHCNWVTSTAYSSPSIVLQAQGAHGERIIFDDFREAYNWLNHNTPPDSKILSWYGTHTVQKYSIVHSIYNNSNHILTNTCILLCLYYIV